MPSAEFRSYRTAAENMRKAITQRSGSSRSPGRDGAPHAASFDGADEEEEGMSDEELMSTMQAQWVEVECLLRVQLRSPDALDEARRHVRASLTFDESLAATAESSKQLKGTIFQALLAFAGEQSPEGHTRGNRRLALAPADGERSACESRSLPQMAAPSRRRRLSTARSARLSGRS